MKNLQFENLNDVNKLYRPPRYGNGPNCGHYRDNKCRKYLTYDEAIKI